MKHITKRIAAVLCSYGGPLYIYKAGMATVHLMEGTKNALTDGAAYTFDDECSSAADEGPNACLYSKADLVIEGAGALTISANRDNGITSKDTLQIYDGVLSVQAANNGINGKDSSTIAGDSISVACGGDAIRSTNDTDETLGWLRVSGSTLDLTAGEDGIQAEPRAACRRNGTKAGGSRLQTVSQALDRHAPGRTGGIGSQDPRNGWEGLGIPQAFLLLSLCNHPKKRLRFQIK